jgi:hypothetical protein
MFSEGAYLNAHPSLIHRLNFWSNVVKLERRRLGVLFDFDDGRSS